MRVMIQEAKIPESQVMLISGHLTRATLERYNIVLLQNVQNAGASLNAFHNARGPRKTAPPAVPQAAPVQSAPA